MVHLTLDDIDWRGGTLKIRQTRTNSRCYFPSLMRQATSWPLLEGGPSAQFAGNFSSPQGASGPLAPTAVHDILDKHRKALSGLKLPVIGSHVLRHSLAVHLLRRGVCLPTIGATLGHRDPESTAVYLRLATEDLHKSACLCPKAARQPCWSERTGRESWFPSATPQISRIPWRFPQRFSGVTSLVSGNAPGLGTSLQGGRRHSPSLG